MLRSLSFDHSSAPRRTQHPMLAASRMVAVLTAWGVSPPLQPACHHHRHRPLQLNFLDDYKADQETRSGMDADAITAFMQEVNEWHVEELRQVAHVKGIEDGVDWACEELMSVHITHVDDGGLLLHELLCSAADERCIAVDVPIPWPENMLVGQLPEMRKAFSEISRLAYAATLDTLPPEYQRQQEELNPLMSLMNAEFGKLLRFYALKHARDALSPTEQVENAKMAQLTFEGLSLELTTLDISAYALDATSLKRKTWSTSILFANRCQSADEVERTLIQMFDNTAAAVEEGRIRVEDVAPEAMSDTIANARREQDDPNLEQEDERTASIRARDRRLRRAVRERRATLYNQQTARYIAASRRWSSTSSAGD